LKLYSGMEKKLFYSRPKWEKEEEENLNFHFISPEKNNIITAEKIKKSQDEVLP
jgi:hypothetical protein